MKIVKQIAPTTASQTVCDACGWRARATVVACGLAWPAAGGAGYAPHGGAEAG
jgi:hypothetical protein